MARSGRIGKKLEKKPGLPKTGFTLRFEYPEEGYDLRKFAEGDFIHTHLRIKNFPRVWTETSKGLFVPYQERSGFNKKEGKLFDSLEGMLDFKTLKINVPENVSQIENDLLQIPYGENKIQLYFGNYPEISYV